MNISSKSHFHLTILMKGLLDKDNHQANSFIFQDQ